jgi:hypothetical protein
VSQKELQCIDADSRDVEGLMQSKYKSKPGLLVAGALICLVASVAFVKSGRAADLGGDCCADLEDRVAELEATTVRKGNKKVSVTLYGQVNRAALFWGFP